MGMSVTGLTHGVTITFSANALPMPLRFSKWPPLLLESQVSFGMSTQPQLEVPIFGLIWP